MTNSDNDNKVKCVAVQSVAKIVVAPSPSPSSPSPPSPMAEDTVTAKSVAPSPSSPSSSWLFIVAKYLVILLLGVAIGGQFGTLDLFEKSDGRIPRYEPEAVATPVTGLTIETKAPSTEMNHLVVDVFNLPFDFLNSPSRMLDFLDGLVEDLELTVADRMIQAFVPEGLTALYLLTESHVSVHTWPSDGYAAFDLLTCGSATTEEAVNMFQSYLQEIAPDLDFRFSFVRRGIENPPKVDDVAVLMGELYMMKDLLHRTQSPHQTIEVWEMQGPSFVYGYMGTTRALYLDGVMKTATSDEDIYHEALVHPALLAHPRPQRVGVLGGGDGGALREVLQHTSVVNAVLVELDAEVVRVAEEYLPALGSSIYDPRASVTYEDPLQWLSSDAAASLDVLLIDLDVTVGAIGDELAAEGRLRGAIADMKQSLGPHGVVVLQVGKKSSDPVCAYSTQFDCESVDRQGKIWLALQNDFAYIHTYSIFIPSRLAEITFIGATDSPTVNGRWSRSGEKVDADILERLRHQNNTIFFNGASMHRMQNKKNLWPWMGQPSVQVEEAAFSTEEGASDAEDLCPHLRRAGDNSLLPGLTVPYMLARSEQPSGLAVHALRNIRKGEVVWRFRDESCREITEHNWRSEMDAQIAEFSPSLGDNVAEQETARRAYLQKEWISAFPNEDGSVAMYACMDDERFSNHGPLSSASEAFTEFLHREGPADYAAARGRVKVAVRDVVACEELLFDRFDAANSGLEPTWWRELIKEAGHASKHAKTFRYAGTGLATHD